MLKNIITIFRKTFVQFTNARASHAAAGIAYYALFSLFPLLILFVVISSYFLDKDMAVRYAVEFASSVLPESSTFLVRNIIKVFTLRTSVGLLSAASLTWSATGVFSALAFNINLAWTDANKRGFLKNRLVAFGMLVALAILFMAYLAMITHQQMLPIVVGSIFGDVVKEVSKVSKFLNIIASWGGIFLLYFALFRWIPAVTVGWKSVVWGALVGTILWQTATGAFVWYLKTGFGHFDLIYGSLGALVSLLILVYFFAWITLFCAHLCAEIESFYAS